MSGIDNAVVTLNEFKMEGNASHFYLGDIYGLYPENNLDYKIEENGLKNHPELSGIRALFIPKQKNLLLL